MSATCPDGHRSATDDYCDQCGARIDSSRDDRVSLTQPAEIMAAMTAVVNVPPATERCPACDGPRATSDRFCESCGFDFSVDPSRAAEPAAPPVHARGRWTAVIAADRAHFDRVAPDGIAFPSDLRPQTFALDESEFRIGREEAGGDPAVSRLHAVILREGDLYVIVDKGSTNGTRINDDARPIAANIPLPLADGDRLYLGAWTTITLLCEPLEPQPEAS